MTHGELRDLYQKLLLDHGRHPRNFRKIAQPTSTTVGHNPLCGDKFVLYLDIEQNRVKDISFEGQGCAISIASASIMSELIKGQSIETSISLFEYFQKLITQGPSQPPQLPDVDMLEVFSGICKYPARIKCATLIWHTLHAALLEKNATVTTE